MTIAQSKSVLAKLLATENISVRRDSNAQTAAFDIKNRVLIVPVWHGISEDLHDLLLVHETGHALDTPCDGWLDAIKKLAKKHHVNPSTRHEMAIKGFLNVIEDARIDKRQKRRYPGSRRNYLAGYKELMQRGFFGPPSKDFNTYNFIDRLNVYFKGGFATIKFSSEEMPYVKRVENAETFEDVLKLTDEIYGYCKAKGEEQQNTPTDIELSEEDVEFEFEFDGDEDVEDEFEDDEDGDGDAEGNSKGKSRNEDQQESNNRKTVNSQNDRNEPGKSGNSQDNDFVPESQTDKTWEQKQKELTNKSVEYIYATIPKPILSNILDDYKIVLKQNDSYNSQEVTPDQLSFLQKSFSEFKSAENAAISFMVKEFEMKKSADLYSKIAIAKTGVIDTNKLHSYKYNDDIFRRLSVLPKGKNHGFIMFVDWSGSMSYNLKSTINQLMSMVLFCKRVQIPFEVYIFRDPNRDEILKECFEYKVGDIVLGTFKLRNVLSSRMSLSEMNRAFLNFWILANKPYSRLEPLSGTPLNAAIIAATELVNQFRDRNKLQIVNTIFLTDGGSDPVLCLHKKNNHSYSSWNKKKVYIIQDEITKKEYFQSSENRLDNKEVTNTLLRNLKDRTGCNLIGFYLYSSYGRNSFNYVYGDFFGDRSNNAKLYETMKKSWEDNKFAPVTSAGYDEYYIINAHAMSDTKTELVIDSNMSKNKIAKNFLSFAEKKSVNRVLLQRFINLTSTMAKAG